MQDARLQEALLPDDHFPLMLRRQGWHLIECAPPYTDPRIIKSQAPLDPSAPKPAYSNFYEALCDNSLRKVLRSILTGARTRDDLTWICSNETRLNAILSYLECGSVIVKQDNVWKPGPQCAGINNIGTTLEWCVAEWFRRELRVPTRHGVKLQEVRGGGDLDVVAFINDTRVFVECKSGHPGSLTETAIRWFLQRVHDFAPEIGILLVDTDASVEPLARIASGIFAEMHWLEANPAAIEPPDDIMQPPGRAVSQEPPGYPGVYPLACNAFLVGVPKSLDASITAVLRFYHAFIQHNVFDPIALEWDFVARKVQGKPGQRFGVEGQVWFK